MVEMAIDAIVILFGAGVAIFLILIAINIALFVKLRSSIPQEPSPNSE
jgi:hypothetical protein